LIETIQDRVVGPLKAARDDVEWSDALESVLEPWLHLRLALVVASIELEGEGVLDEFEEAVNKIDEVPLTLLPEPAHGAARYAIAMLGSVGAGLIAATRRRKKLDFGLLEALLEEIAVIELAWLTIAGSDRPAALVAEAAAWEAYSRVRPLRVSLIHVGLDATLLPVEEPSDAMARAEELLGRVARGWTPEERAAVEQARMPTGALQG